MIAEENGKCYFQTFEEAEIYRKNVLDIRKENFFRATYNFVHGNFKHYIDIVTDKFPHYKVDALVWYGKNHKK